MPPVVHHPAYQAEIPATHRFPMGKYRRLAEVLAEEGLRPMGGFHEPEPAPAAWLGLAHDPAYVDAVLAQEVPAKVVREIGLPVTGSVALRARLAAGGTVLAARLALRHGLALNTAGGSHHARRAQGAGFCVFNDVGVAASVLLAERAVRRVVVVDLDVHQGDGTADIFAGDARVTTFSMHAEKNYPFRKIPSSLDVGLPDATEDAAYLDELDRHLPHLLGEARPDLVFYNAGVDPHADDRLGRLRLGDDGLAERDRRVLAAARRAGVPLVGVMGGGYDDDVDRLARRHTILHRVASEFG